MEPNFIKPNQMGTYRSFGVLIRGINTYVRLFVWQGSARSARERQSGACTCAPSTPPRTNPDSGAGLAAALEATACHNTQHDQCHTRHCQTNFFFLTKFRMRASSAPNWRLPVTYIPLLGGIITSPYVVISLFIRLRALPLLPQSCATAQ